MDDAVAIALERGARRALRLFDEAPARPGWIAREGRLPLAAKSDPVAEIHHVPESASMFPTNTTCAAYSIDAAPRNDFGLNCPLVIRMLSAYDDNRSADAVAG
jgi:hypothetical protein